MKGTHACHTEGPLPEKPLTLAGEWKGGRIQGDSLKKISFELSLTRGVGTCQEDKRQRLRQSMSWKALPSPATLSMLLHLSLLHFSHL